MPLVNEYNMSTVTKSAPERFKLPPRAMYSSVLENGVWCVYINNKRIAAAGTRNEARRIAQYLRNAGYERGYVTLNEAKEMGLTLWAT